MNGNLIPLIAFLGFSLMGCTGENEPNPEIKKTDPNMEELSNPMKSFVSLVEIPVSDLSRATDFYQTILDIPIEKMEIPEMEMGIFPYEEQAVTVILIKGEGYIPSTHGVTIYLNGGDDLQTVLDKVEENGGEILLPKTAHADESGFFALFIDTEGNRLGLNSPN